MANTAWIGLAENQTRLGGRSLLQTSSALNYTSRLCQHRRGDSSKQPGPVASPLAGSLQKCLCEPGSNSSIRRESGSGHYMLLRTLKEKEAGCWGHAATHHFLWDVGLKPYPLSQSWSLALPLKCWPQGNSQQPEHSPACQSHTCRPPGLLIGFGQCRAGKTWPE